MGFPACQYSQVSWIRKDSAAFKALSDGLKHDGRPSPDRARAAVTTFLSTLSSAHEEFKSRIGPDANLPKLLQAYQDKTGIISTRDFTLPDIPDDPSGPGSSFFTDMIEGIAGAAMTEIGVGISLYTLVMDLVALFNIKLHLRGVVFNTAATDLEDVRFQFGPNGQPNMLPLSRTIPAAKSIMNPLDKKNYDCVGFTMFGGVGEQSLQGFYISMAATRKKRQELIEVYCQYYEILKGIAQGRDDRSHGPLLDFCETSGFTGVMAEQMFPNQPKANGVVAIMCK